VTTQGQQPPAEPTADDRRAPRAVPGLPGPAWSALVAAAALAGILLLDGVTALHHWPLPVLGLLDEPAHLLTAGLVLAAVLPVRAARVVPWVLAGAVLIDLDHVPLYLWGALSVDGSERPVTHSLSTVAVLAVLGVAGRGRVRTALLGLTAGVLLHLVRDLGTGPGVPLGWPVVPGNVLLPYGLYLATLAVVTAAVIVRQLARGRTGRLTR
jgi:inner membrane protein